jgi:mannose-6-phosphate isomerase class I
VAGEILRLEPVLKPMVWGSEKWVASAHPHGDCLVVGGGLSGRRLSELWSDKRELFGNTRGADFPLLIKIIDAKSDLSIQVHPDDAYAMQHENRSLGKTECWYVMKATGERRLIVGHNAERREELTRMMAENRWNELLREMPVKEGDWIQIEPGTLHAIKGGSKLLEIQENSDITYRVYDYGRLVDGKPRALHLEKSLEVIRVPALPPEVSLIESDGEAQKESHRVLACDYYDIGRLEVAGSAQLELSDRFMLVYVLAGEGRMAGEVLQEEDCFLVPCGYGEVTVTGTVSLIVVTQHEA